MRDEVKLVIPTSWEPDRNKFLAALGVSLAACRTIKS